MTYSIFTDGSYMDNEMRFGMGFLIPDLRLVKEEQPCIDLIPRGYDINVSNLDDEIIASRNIVGELMAAMYAITVVLTVNPNVNIICNYDYTGVEAWATGAWSANKLLPRMYRAWFNWNNLHTRVTFNHTKAHEVSEGNNLADMFARSGSNGIMVPRLERRIIDGNSIYNLVFISEESEVRCGFSY